MEFECDLWQNQGGHNRPHVILSPPETHNNEQLPSRKSYTSPAFKLHGQGRANLTGTSPFQYPGSRRSIFELSSHILGRLSP